VRSRDSDVVRAAALLGGSVLLAALFVRLGPARILSLLTSLGWNFPVIVVLFAAHELVRTLALRCWLPADRRPPLTELFRIRLLGEGAGALTRTGALAAEPARAWLLANPGGQGAIGYSAAAGELMANSATSAAVNVAVAGGVLMTSALKGPVVVLAHVLCWSSLVYLSAIIGVVVSRVPILDACAHAAARLPVVGRRLRIDPSKLRDVEATAAALMARRPTLARLLLLEISAQVILVCEVYWSIRSMGVALSGRSALLIEVMTRALTIVEFVGATEVGFAVVFAWLGLPAAIGFTLSLVKTLRSLTAAGFAIGLPTDAERPRARLVAKIVSGATTTMLALATAAVLGAAGQPVSDLQPELEAVLSRDLHFSPADLVDLQHSKLVKHTLPPAALEEVGVVGAVRVRGSRARFMAAYRDIIAFRKSAAVLEIGRFSDPPTSSDLDALTTSRDDFDLRGCRIAGCDIRLPEIEIRRIAAGVDWRRPDADRQASAFFKQMVVAHVRSYVTGAPGLIAQYDDGRTPVLPVIAGEDLIRTSGYLDALQPGLAAHISCFRSNPLEGAEDFLYWTKEKLALAPFISVTHVTIVPSGAHQSLATSRDVYSSRYIDASLSMTIASDTIGDSQSFYLAYVNRSRASALRGPMAGLRRSIVERKARAALDSNLREIKARVEVR